MKNSSQKKLLSLDVEKHAKTAHAIVTGEANGSFVKKVLKTIDKCNYVWTNEEMKNVSEGAGLISGTLPIIVFTTIGTMLNNAALKPLGRAVGFKGLRCKKRKDRDEEDECNDEDEDDMDDEDECNDEDEDDMDDEDECEDDEDEDDEDEDDEDECEDDEDEDDEDECEDDEDEDDEDECEDDEDDEDDEDECEDDEDECEDYNDCKKND